MDGQFARRQNRAMENFVRKFRKERKWTQERLASEAQVSQGTVSQIELGQQEPGALNFLRVARALGVSPEDLVPGFERNEALDEVAAEISSLNPKEREGAVEVLQAYLKAVRPEMPQ